MHPPHITIRLPEYRLDAHVDLDDLGRGVDARVAQETPDGHYVVRAIASSDHRGMSLEDLVAIVLETGTDRYDPGRKEVGYEEFRGYDHDLHGDRFTIRNGELIPDGEQVRSTMFGDIAYHFAIHAPLDRGHPLRVDLLLVYRAELLESARHVRPLAPTQPESLTRHLFRFVHPERKAEALECVVSILP